MMLNNILALLQPLMKYNHFCNYYHVVHIQIHLMSHCMTKLYVFRYEVMNR